LGILKIITYKKIINAFHVIQKFVDSD